MRAVSALVPIVQWPGLVYTCWRPVRVRNANEPPTHIPSVSDVSIRHVSHQSLRHKCNANVLQ